VRITHRRLSEGGGELQLKIAPTRLRVRLFVAGLIPVASIVSSRAFTSVGVILLTGLSPSAAMM
jgi:hypothetical protein